MTNPIKNSLVFYRSFYESIKTIPEKEQLEIYNAIFEYSLNFQEPKLTGISSAIFTLIKPQLEANKKKYLNGMKGGEHGKKGGRPKINNPIVTPKEPKNNPIVTPNVNDNVNDNDNDNVNDNVSKKEKELTENRFLEFWDLYDYKVSKPKAKISYLKSLKIETHENIILGVKKTIKTRKEDKQYWKHPSSWLNSQSWLDELTSIASNNNIDDSKLAEVNKIMGTSIVKEIKLDGYVTAYLCVNKNDEIELKKILQFIADEKKEELRKIIGEKKRILIKIIK